MLRRCEAQDFGAILAVVNDAAQVYRGVIADDCCGDPYMPQEELRAEIASGVAFWGFEEAGKLVSVMGLQHMGDVALIRHAYTHTTRQHAGLGSLLLGHLRREARYPMLVGTWRAATWAVRFYEKRGFKLVPQQDKARLLRRYWTVPERQIEESVVLADPSWFTSLAQSR